MSGQGEKLAHNSNGLRPAGNGGGCIASGPFKGMTVNLGYVFLVAFSSTGFWALGVFGKPTIYSPLAVMGDVTMPKNSRLDGYGYNPCCIKRDISNYLTNRDATIANITALVTGSASIGTFQDTMQSGTGVHSAGHFTVSGDPRSGTSPLSFLLRALLLTY